MIKLYLSKPQDIPLQWKRYEAQKKTHVTIRECNPNGESFKVSWGESLLYATSQDDIIVIQPDGCEYPCKKDVFHTTYEPLDGKYIKKAKSTLVAIPEGYDLTIGTLEGDVNDVCYPDYIVIGAKDELYVNTKQTVDEHMIIEPL